MKTFVLFYCQPCLRWVEQGEREKESKRERVRARERSLHYPPLLLLLLHSCCSLPVTLLHSLSRSRSLFCAWRALSFPQCLHVCVCLCVHARMISFSLSLTRALLLPCNCIPVCLHPLLLCCCCCFNFCCRCRCCCCFCCCVVVLCVLGSARARAVSASENYATFTNRTLQKVEVNLPRSNERSLSRADIVVR